MKRLASTVAVALAALALLASSGAFAGSTTDAGSVHGAGGSYGFARSWSATRPPTRPSTTAIRSLAAITAEKDPQSIFGGFGGLGEAGAATVRQRYLLAAGAFRPSGAEVDFEYLVKDVRGKLAYTVAIERADVLYAGQTELHQQVLRSP